MASNAIALNAPIIAVSGCPRYDAFKGRVRAYVNDGDAWTFDTFITASDAVSYDEFGSAVSLYRSCTLIPFPACLTRLAVGAPWKYHGIEWGAGSAYVFSGTNWSEQAIFTHPFPDAFEATFFGGEVALGFDNWIAIGAPFTNGADG